MGPRWSSSMPDPPGEELRLSCNELISLFLLTMLSLAVSCFCSSSWMRFFECVSCLKCFSSSTLNSSNLRLESD